jgi:hypothetical protein
MVREALTSFRPAAGMPMIATPPCCCPFQQRVTQTVNATRKGRKRIEVQTIWRITSSCIYHTHKFEVAEFNRIANLPGRALRVAASEGIMQQAVRKYLKALEAGDVEKAAALFTVDGWVRSPFLGQLPVRDFVTKVAGASSGTKLIVHDVLISAEGHMRAVAYYLYDWRLKDGSNTSFECADVFNFDPSTGHIASIVLVYDTHLVRDVVENKYP